jgi:xanthine dehydrogenase YagS FAD-binding subunit
MASYPGDFAVMLAALDGVVDLSGYNGTRTVAAKNVHRLPSDSGRRDSALSSAS